VEQEPKTPRERAEDLIRLLVPDWRPTEAQVLWTARIVIVLCGLGFIGVALNIPLVAVAQLLLGAAIPVAIALVGNRFTQQRTQDDAFQSYLDKMGDLMLDKDSPLSSVEADDPLLTLARARTAAVVQRLDAEGSRSVVRFLQEAG
jgi:hypothetical protein